MIDAMKQLTQARANLNRKRAELAQELTRAGINQDQAVKLAESLIVMNPWI